MDNNLPRHSRSGLVSRLGKVSIAVLISLFVVCLGCLTFLAFLWGANTNNSVWRSIILTGWTIRSITITSLILRWAAASQAAICTSMLAAILLQIGAVPLPTAAAISIIRYNATGPWSLLSKMKIGWHYGSISIGLLAILFTFTTLSLQFTSTALLSQVGRASLPVAIYVPQTYYGIDPNGTTFNSLLGDLHSPVLGTTPTRYPAFAEWISNATSSNTTAQHGEFAPNNAPGIRDTGTIIRAFLPIVDNDERSRLIAYHGFGTVVDTRIVCMRPKLTNAMLSSEGGLHITGLADIEQKPLGLLRQPDEQGSNNFSLSFDCGIAARFKGDSETYGWPLTLCKPIFENSRQGIYSVMEPKGLEELGESFLLINATTTDFVTDLDVSDVWESITLADGDLEVSLQLTLCMAAFEAQEMEINATRPVPVPSEPALSWNTSTTTYNTKAVLRQLGARVSSIPTTERGIFDLAPRSWRRPEQVDVSLNGGAFSTTRALEVIDSYYDSEINAQYSVLTQMASSTADPALALQAFLTILCAVCYYDQIVMFDTAAPSSQISLVQVVRPLGWTAFTIVASVAMLHLLLVLLTILIFRRAGNLSQIHNAWASISQLLGPITEDWIRDTDTVDDKRVKSWLKDRGLHKMLVGVEDVQSRVLLIKKDKVL